MQISRQTFGELTCRVVTPDAREGEVDGVVVLCHGFGAPGDDLVPLADEIVRRDRSLGERLMFAFPAAPLQPPELCGGRAWWPLDVVALQAAIERRNYQDRRLEVPDFLPQSRHLLVSLVDGILTQTGLPLSRVVLGGFSQGAMLATDVCLRLHESVAGLMIFSGTLICEPEWRRLAPQRAGLRVLQCHGTLDPLLPFEAAEWLRDLLVEAGAAVEFHSFAGMHTIDREGLQAGVRFLNAVLNATPNGDT